MRPRSRPSFARSSRCAGAGALLLVAACALSSACGGSAASEAHAPEATAGPEEKAAESSNAEAEPEVAQAPAPRCADGTCFECGEGLCPQGFYCDRDASGGPACSWVPDCAKKPTCACLQRTLGKSCSCDDGSGGPTVTCR